MRAINLSQAPQVFASSSLRSSAPPLPDKAGFLSSGFDASLSASLLVFVCIASLVVSGCAAEPKDTLVGPRSTQLGEQPRRADQEDAFALSKRAENAYDESRWIDAARDFKRLTELVPRDANAWFRLGNTYAQQGAYERAIHAYEQSVAFDADQPKPWFNLSTAYLLNAQSAMNRAHSRLRPGDPARALIEQRLTVLESLIHGRFEESATPTTAGDVP